MASRMIVSSRSSSRSSGWCGRPATVDPLVLVEAAASTTRRVGSRVPSLRSAGCPPSTGTLTGLTPPRAATPPGARNGNEYHNLHPRESGLEPPRQSRADADLPRHCSTTGDEGRIAIDGTIQRTEHYLRTRR